MNKVTIIGERLMKLGKIPEAVLKRSVLKQIKHRRQEYC